VLSVIETTGVAYGNQSEGPEAIGEITSSCTRVKEHIGHQDVRPRVAGDSAGGVGNCKTQRANR
jgi:hypothetical protein